MTKTLSFFQIQDAKNHLQLALEKVQETKTNCNFSSGKEVSKVQY